MEVRCSGAARREVAAPIGGTATKRRSTVAPAASTTSVKTERQLRRVVAQNAHPTIKRAKLVRRIASTSTTTAAATPAATVPPSAPQRPTPTVAAAAAASATRMHTLAARRAVRPVPPPQRDDSDSDREAESLAGPPLRKQRDPELRFARRDARAEKSDDDESSATTTTTTTSVAAIPASDVAPDLGAPAAATAAAAVVPAATTTSDSSSALEARGSVQRECGARRQRAGSVAVGAAPANDAKSSLTVAGSERDDIEEVVVEEEGTHDQH